MEKVRPEGTDRCKIEYLYVIKWPITWLLVFTVSFRRVTIPTPSHLTSQSWPLLRALLFSSQKKNEIRNNQEGSWFWSSPTCTIPGGRIPRVRVSLHPVKDEGQSRVCLLLRRYHPWSSFSFLKESSTRSPT